jgi:hypothetical protein
MSGSIDAGLDGSEVAAAILLDVPGDGKRFYRKDREDANNKKFSFHVFLQSMMQRIRLHCDATRRKRKY